MSLLERKLKGSINKLLTYPRHGEDFSDLDSVQLPFLQGD